MSTDSTVSTVSTPSGSDEFVVAVPVRPWEMITSVYRDGLETPCVAVMAIYGYDSIDRNKVSSYDIQVIKESSPAQLVVLDISNLVDRGEEPCNAVFHAYRRLKSVGCTFAVVAASGQAEAYRRMRLQRVIGPVFESVGEATAALRVADKETWLPPKP